MGAAPTTRTAVTVIARAAVVSCVDPRIQKLLDQFRNLYDLNKCCSTPHSVPGAALNINRVLPDIDMAVRRLGATEIHVVDHFEPECKAYVETYGAGYPQEKHAEQLKAARELLQKRYPDVVIKTHLLMVPDTIIEIF